MIKWLRKLFSSPCPKTCTGRVWYDHEEPVGKWNTWINVYRCDECGEYFI